jgi:hypothetical protein
MIDQMVDGVCAVCGKPVDRCICPECPVCEEYGNPACYQQHGLVCTAEQTRSKRAAWSDEMFESAKMELAMDRTMLDMADDGERAEQEEWLRMSEANLIAWASFVP